MGSPPGLQVSWLTTAQLPTAVQLLAAAFIDEPLITAILPDPAERVRLIASTSST